MKKKFFRIMPLLLGVILIFLLISFIEGFKLPMTMLFMVICFCILLTTLFLHLTEKLKPIEWRYVPNDKPFTLVKCVAAKIKKEERNKPKLLQKGEYLYHIQFGILHYTILYSLPIPYKDGTKIMKLSNGEIVSCTSKKNLKDSSEYFHVKDKLVVI